MTLDGNLVPVPVADNAVVIQSFTGNECDPITCQENATCVTDAFDVGGYHCECDSGFVEEDGVCKERLG